MVAESREVLKLVHSSATVASDGVRTPKARQPITNDERPRKRGKRARELRYTSTPDWDPSSLEGDLRAGGGDEGEPGDPFREMTVQTMVVSETPSRVAR